MPGDRWQAFANLRCLLAYMWSYPGKKLLFMGSEWGSPKEWSQDESLPWHLLDDPDHAGIQRLVKRLNAIYGRYLAISHSDHRADGFQWIHHDDHTQSIIAFLRRMPPQQASRIDTPPAATLLIVCNFTPVPRPAYRIGVPSPGCWQVLFNSDDASFGGSAYPLTADAQKVSDCTSEDKVMVWAKGLAWQGQDFSIDIDLPPLAVLYLLAPHEAARCLP